MRRMVVGVAMVASMAAFASGCSGDGGGGPGAGGGSIPLDQLATEYTSAVCQKVFSCCDAAEIADSNPTFPDEAACRTGLGAQVAAEIELYKLRVEASRIIYTGGRARGCIDALKSAPCVKYGGDEELRRFPDCMHIFEGALAAGGACEQGESDECKDGYCEAGVCVAYARAGESCSGTSCAPEISCAYNASGIPTTCRTPLPDGAACTYDSDCQNFCEAQVCGPPTFCNGV